MSLLIRVLPISLLPLLFMATGCPSQGNKEEALGHGIVQGTLGAHAEGGQPIAPPGGADSVSGSVLALEGGAYLLRRVDGAEHRIPLDENTRIDRPAHVGDKIEAFLDKQGRAVFIRNIDQSIDHSF